MDEAVFVHKTADAAPTDRFFEVSFRANEIMDMCKMTRSEMVIKLLKRLRYYERQYGLSHFDPNRSHN